MPRTSHIDWSQIRLDYVQNAAMTQASLAAKYGVTEAQVRGRAFRDHWLAAREDYAQQYAQRLTELSLRKDAPQLIRELNEEWLKQSKELRYMLNSKLKVRDAQGNIVVRADVNVNEIVRACAGFAELFRMDRLALGASTDNLTPALPENKYDEMSEDELIIELKRVRAQNNIVIN